MADQNNAPERIWIKPCDPCENPYDYYVCDPRYLDGRETSYVKSVVSCADRAAPEGQMVTLTYTNWRGETAERTITPKRIWFGSPDWHPEPQWLLTAFDAEKQADRDFALKDFWQAPPPAAPTDNTALVEAAQQAVNEWAEHLEDGDPVPTWVAPLAAALSGREAQPACQQEAVTEACQPLLDMDMWTESAQDNESVIVSVGTIRRIRTALRALKGGDANG